MCVDVPCPSVTQTRLAHKRFFLKYVATYFNMAISDNLLLPFLPHLPSFYIIPSCLLLLQSNLKRLEAEINL